MTITIGPKGRKTMLSLVFGYSGHGERWGKITFANGFTLRAGSVALHIWQPRGAALSSG